MVPVVNLLRPLIQRRIRMWEPQRTDNHQVLTTIEIYHFEDTSYLGSGGYLKVNYLMDQVQGWTIFMSKANILDLLTRLVTRNLKE